MGIIHDKFILILLDLMYSLYLCYQIIYWLTLTLFAMAQDFPPGGLKYNRFMKTFNVVKEDNRDNFASLGI